METTSVFGRADSNILFQKQPDGGILVAVKTEEMTEFHGVVLSPRSAIEFALEILEMHRGRILDGGSE